MRAHDAHPETTAIAEFQAGDGTGLAFWRAPARRRARAHLRDCARCQAVARELDSVAAALSAAPIPTMPPEVAARLSVALSAEQEARAGDSVPSGAVSPPTAERAGRSPRPVMRRVVMLPVGVAACLAALIVGGTLLFQHSPGPGGTANPQTNAASGHAGMQRPMTGVGATQNTKGVTFAMLSSGTDYSATTLRSQVATVSVPASSVPTSLGSSTQMDTMAACVRRVTNGAQIRFVDRARYEGSPAFIIVSATRVWVTGTGCSGSASDLIVSVALSP